MGKCPILSSQWLVSNTGKAPWPWYYEKFPCEWNILMETGPYCKNCDISKQISLPEQSWAEKEA